ncbi:multiheme c-type cytochrome [Nannocystaceae bacterium ST9]
MTPGHSRGLLGALGLAALALAWAGTAARAQRVALARATAQARDAELPRSRGEDFVGSPRCRSCHPQAYASWHASWHRTMTQALGPETVIARFDGRRLAHADGEHAVERRGDEFWVRMPDADWLLARAERGPDVDPSEAPMRWQQAIMSTGAHNMQMYWVSASPGRRLVAFPFSWSVEAQTWVANEATLLRPHQADVVYGWNEVCSKCHAVAVAPEFAATRVETEVAELGIACEACHGPGRAHVDAQTNPLRRYATHLRAEGAAEIVHPGKLDARRSSEVCGQCHSASVFPDPANWRGRGSDYRPGAELHESTRVVRHPLRADQAWIDDLLDEDPDYLSGRFWGDGMIRVSGREYNGIVEAACFEDPAFGCLSCHEMHGDTPEDQLKPIARFDGDRQCTQCHAAWSDESTLVDHTRHAADSSGSRCVNCHMPHTVYGLTKAIRSHQITSPDVDESVDHGRPNACNACHLDRSLAWAAGELARGWGVEATSPAEPGRAAAVDALVRGDAGQRALAAWSFGWAPAQAASGRDWMAPLLVRALTDDYAAVRWIALRSLRSLPGYAQLDWAHAGATAGPRLDAATLAELDARWPGSPRIDPSVYLNDAGFDAAAWAIDHARRDTRVVDLQE